MFSNLFSIFKKPSAPAEDKPKLLIPILKDIWRSKPFKSHDPYEFIDVMVDRFTRYEKQLGELITDCLRKCNNGLPFNPNDYYFVIDSVDHTNVRIAFVYNGCRISYSYRNGTSPVMSYADWAKLLNDEGQFTALRKFISHHTLSDHINDALFIIYYTSRHEIKVK